MSVIEDYQRPPKHICIVLNHNDLKSTMEYKVCRHAECEDYAVLKGYCLNHIPRKDEVKVCPKCSGNGKYMYSLEYIGECDKCQGKGRI